MKMEFIFPENLISPSICAFFTTARHGKNIAFISEKLGFHGFETFMPVQKHTADVYVLEGASEPSVADAVITNRKDVFIGVAVADCVPILLHDPIKGAIGVVHAGWRGTAGSILKKTIHAMEKYLATSLEHLRIAIGPSISGCCYQVGQEVVEKIKKATGSGEYLSHKHGQRHLALKEANRIQAESLGVHSGNIWISRECTCCDSKHFFSYRRDGKSAGRQGGFIARKD